MRFLALLGVVVGLAATAPSADAATMMPGCVISSPSQLLSCQTSNADRAPGLGPLKAMASGQHECFVKTGGELFCSGEAETQGQRIPAPYWNQYWWRDLPTAAVTDVTTGRWHGCALLAAGNVSCWGSSWHGQRGNGAKEAGFAAAVQGLAPGSVTKFDAGDFHSCAVLTDHAVRCWGSGQQGQLGDGGTTDALTAVPVTGLTDAATVSGGAFHTCAVRTGGRVSCWGANDRGQLGDGTTTDRRTPVEVAGLTDAIAVNAGRTHTCAIRAGGSVVCWGTGLTAQLGLGATTRSLTPAVVDGISGATELLVTPHRTCARTSSDNVWCWGAGGLDAKPQSLQLAAATQVAGLGDATSITTANSSQGGTFCARRAAGTAACWGFTYEQAGRSYFYGRAPAVEVTSPAPQAIPGVDNASAVTSTWNDGVCTVRTGGTVDCRGLDANREPFSYTWGPSGAPLTGVKAIGGRCLVYTDGRAACYPEGASIRGNPTDDVNGITDAIAVSANASASCFLRANGHVLCRGAASYSPIRGNNGDPDPNAGVRGLTDAVDVSLEDGGTSACAVRATGRVRCWGETRTGGLGDGTIERSSVPVDVLGITDARKVSVGPANICVVRSSGRVSCWGYNSQGQLGNGQEGPTTRTAQEVPGITDAVSVAVGYTTLCALRSGGGVACWGEANRGAIGDGVTPTGHFPVLATPTLLPFPVVRNVVAPRILGQATPGQRVVCDPGVWAVGNRIVGANDGAFDGAALSYRTGFLGPDSVSGAFHPPYQTTGGATRMTCWVAASSGGARTVVQSETRTTTSTPYPETLAAGGAHSCAVRADGTAWCWGSNKFGQLGRGTVGDSAVRVRVGGLTGVRSIAAGDRHACALLTDRSVRCWGFNLYGQLGDGTNANQYKPVAVQGLTDAVQLSVGDRHTCALRAAGAVVCWGLGASGRLGHGSTADASTPVAVSGLTDATKVSAGGRSTCAVRRGGLAVCWGAGDNGRLGNGAQASSSTPVTVGGGLTDAMDVAVGGSHACVIRNYGLLVCWGANARGQLGDGTTADRTAPVQIDIAGVDHYLGPPIVQLGLGGDTSCARIGGGKVYCWGAGATRQLGDDTTADRSQAARVPGVDDASALAVGPGRSCARRALSGHASCWGDVSATPTPRPELIVAP